MFLNKKIILLCLSILFIIGCKNEHFSFLSKKERLISNIWEINTFIDHSTNTSFEIPYSTYEFKEDGTFIVTPEYPVLPQYATWEFIDKEQYLRIGSNTFKIKIISQKLLGLQYGDVDIFYVPTGN